MRTSAVDSTKTGIIEPTDRRIAPRYLRPAHPHRRRLRESPFDADEIARAGREQRGAVHESRVTASWVELHLEHAVRCASAKIKLVVRPREIDAPPLVAHRILLSRSGAPISTPAAEFAPNHPARRSNSGNPITGSYSVTTSIHADSFSLLAGRFEPATRLVGNWRLFDLAEETLDSDMLASRGRRRGSAHPNQTISEKAHQEREQPRFATPDHASH